MATVPVAHSAPSGPLHPTKRQCASAVADTWAVAVVGSPGIVIVAERAVGLVAVAIARSYVQLSNDGVVAAALPFRVALNVTCTCWSFSGSHGGSAAPSGRR